MIVRHKLLADLVKLWKNDELVEKIDRLPIELSPRKSKPLGRCCVHKERAVWRYKTFPLMGLDMTDEHDEVTPLSEYARLALSRPEPDKENIMCVIDEACSSCVQINYEITNLCRGCVARSCYMNCPKDAIRFKKNGQAMIDHDTCVSCGICHKSCPYHAIVYIPVPCEESCPVKAISKDEHGIEHIDESKCIYCGKCMNACPFGAIFEISQTFDVLQRIRKGEKMVAIVAPSILGQFKTSIGQVYGAFKEIGFTDVIEVAEGAMATTSNEAHELLEKLEEGQKFMTTSCCPSYIELVEKHIPDMKPYVSTTGSPMYYTARIAKEKHPDAKVVFVGPCVAKRLSGCGSGTEYLAVTPTGDLYPCHQFVGNTDFLMGNVDDGVVNTDLRDEFKSCNVYAKDKCRECFARFYCSGGCAANSYNFHGDIHNAYDIGCALQKKRVECAIMIKAALAAKEGEEV